MTLAAEQISVVNGARELVAEPLITPPEDIAKALARFDAIREAKEAVWARTLLDNIETAREVAIGNALAGKPLPVKSILVEAEDDRRHALATQAVLADAEERQANAVGSVVGLHADAIFDQLRTAHDAIIDRARKLAPLVSGVHANFVHRTDEKTREAWDEMLGLAQDYDRVRARAGYISRRFLGNVQLDLDERFVVWKSGFIFTMAGQGRRIVNPLPSEPVQKMVALAEGDPWLPTPEERDQKVQALADARKQAHNASASF